MPDKNPLVLIVGRMNRAATWRYQIDHFSKQREVITPDAHHHLPSIREMAESILADLPERFDLVGWSMGGYIAFEICAMAGDRVNKLGLVATSARPETETEAAAREGVLIAAREANMSLEWARGNLANATGTRPLDSSFTEQIMTNNMAMGLDVMRSQAGALMGRRDARLLLPSITCPTLVTTGLLDSIIPAERSTEMAALLPNATLRTFDDVGHCVLFEAPDELNVLMEAFF